MTELDLREDLAAVREEITAQSRLPSLAELAGRGARRRRRDWTFVAAAALVCAGLVGGSAVLFGGTDRATVPARSPSPPVPSESSSGSTSNIDGFLMVDTSTIYVSTTGVWRGTHDGGVSWQDMPVPSWADPLNTRPSRAALDRQTLTIGKAITHDGGHTWARRPDDGAPVAQVANGSALVVYARGAAGGSKLGVMDLATGQLHPLARPPANCPEQVLDDWRPADGSYWVVCPDGLAISRDRAASWEWHPLGPPSGKVVVGNAAVATRDGRIGYAELSDDRHQGFGLYKTTDSGRTWRFLRNVAQSAAGLAVLPDGSFLTVDLANKLMPLYRSTDDGRTFTQLTPPLSSNHPYITVGGAYGAGGFSGNTHFEYMSEDGLRFRPVPLPPGAHY